MSKYIQSGGAFKKGMHKGDQEQDNNEAEEAFLSDENFKHLWRNINQILSYEYNHPIVVDPQTLQGTMRHFADTYEPHTKCSLNKRVIEKIKNMFRDDQHDIRIANEWDDEEFDVLARNEDTVYNPVPVPIRTEQLRQIQFIDM